MLKRMAENNEISRQVAAVPAVVVSESEVDLLSSLLTGLRAEFEQVNVKEVKKYVKVRLSPTNDFGNIGRCSLR
jgi:hypothetical protein